MVVKAEEKMVVKAEETKEVEAEEKMVVKAEETKEVKAEEKMVVKAEEAKIKAAILLRMQRSSADKTAAAKEPLDKLKLLANNGDPVALNRLADKFFYGEGLKTNKKMAALLYKKAAQEGNIDAQYAAAIMYYNGDGVNRNFSEATRLFGLDDSRKYDIHRIFAEVNNEWDEEADVSEKSPPKEKKTKQNLEAAGNTYKNKKHSTRKNCRYDKKMRSQGLPLRTPERTQYR